MSRPFVRTLPLSSMDFVRTNQEFFDYPEYTFRKQGDFHYSLRVRDRKSGNQILEINFMEPDMMEFIMQAEMVMRVKEER